MHPLENVLNRPRLYNNIDGLVELAGGTMLLSIAVLLRLPANSLWHRNSWLILLALALAIRFGIEAIKTRITYPRTGFVEYRRSGRRRTSIAAFLAGAMIPVGLSMVLRRHWDITTPAALIGLIFAGAYADRIARTVRWKWIVACAIGLGSIAIAFLPTDILAAIANDTLATHPVRARLSGTILASFFTCGVMLLISGSISFWLYLRHTQKPRQEGE